MKFNSHRKLAALAVYCLVLFSSCSRFHYHSTSQPMMLGISEKGEVSVDASVAGSPFNERNYQLSGTAGFSPINHVTFLGRVGVDRENEEFFERSMNYWGFALGTYYKWDVNPNLTRKKLGPATFVLDGYVGNNQISQSMRIFDDYFGPALLEYESQTWNGALGAHLNFENTGLDFIVESTTMDFRKIYIIEGVSNRFYNVPPTVSDIKNLNKENYVKLNLMLRKKYYRAEFYFMLSGSHYTYNVKTRGAYVGVRYNLRQGKNLL